MRLGSFQLPNGASLSYAEYGTSTGNPVLLFHGLVGSICSEGMEGSLCGLPMRVIALARPGYKLHRFNYSIVWLKNIRI